MIRKHRRSAAVAVIAAAGIVAFGGAGMASAQTLSGDNTLSGQIGTPNFSVDWNLGSNIGDAGSNNNGSNTPNGSGLNFGSGPLDLSGPGWGSNTSPGSGLSSLFGS